MSEYANYIEQSAYEDGLAKGRNESKKRIEELEASVEIKEADASNARLDKELALQENAELEAKLDAVRSQNSELRAGFQGACYCCESVGELNVQLCAENEQLKASIERVYELPLLLTDDEDSCMVMRRMIDDAVKGNNYEL